MDVVYMGTVQFALSQSIQHGHLLDHLNGCGLHGNSSVCFKPVNPTWPFT